MNTLFARDALDSVKLHPTSALLWQRLSALALELQPAERDAIAVEIAAVPVEAGEAAWLKYSALFGITRDIAWARRQAALAGEATSPDAIMTLLYLTWHHALARIAVRREFAETLDAVDPVRLQRLIARRFPVAEPPARAPGKPLRVAVYASQVNSNRNGGTAFMLNLISALTVQGMEVAGFTAQEPAIPVAQGYCGGNEWPVPPAVARDSLAAPAPTTAKLSLPNTELSLRWRLEQSLRDIQAYEPDVVLFVGIMSPMVFALYGDYPVLGMSVHTVAPIAPLDVWLCPRIEDEPAPWPSLPTARSVEFPFRFWPGNAATPVDRALTGAADDAVILVTVGVRLPHEIKSPWREQMLAFLDAYGRAHWLLIGVSESDSPDSLPQHPRIRRIAPQSNLDQWLAGCDIYVNPPRMGGGASVAKAMELGVPVASFADSDGGDKVGDLAASSEEGYFDLLAAWLADPALRHEAGQSLKDQFHSRLDISSQRAGSALVQACEAAIDSFQQRRKQPIA